MSGANKLPQFWFDEINAEASDPQVAPPSLEARAGLNKRGRPRGDYARQLWQFWDQMCKQDADYLSRSLKSVMADIEHRFKSGGKWSADFPRSRSGVQGAIIAYRQERQR